MKNAEVYTKCIGVWSSASLADNDYYRVSPELDPEGPEAAGMKVLRGGSWVNNIDGVGATQRARNVPDMQNNIYGFRTVLPLQ